MIDIRELRRSAEMTLKQLGECAGISESYAHSIENGKRRPSPEVAKKIANTLGFEWTKFFED